jgi:hypothetical protein
MAFYTMDLETATNEDFALAFDLSDGTAAIDLTGAGLDMKVRGASGTALELSTANGKITIADAAAGGFALSVPASEMSALAPGVYTHDCVLSQGGQSFALWSGRLLITQGIS